VYQRFIVEEDARLQAELDEKKQMQDKEAEAYETALRDRCCLVSTHSHRQRRTTNPSLSSVLQPSARHDHVANKRVVDSGGAWSACMA
jgi:hypothetical protein